MNSSVKNNEPIILEKESEVMLSGTFSYTHGSISYRNSNILLDSFKLFF